MGLFDKKYCDVCGDKIGILGNRKLEDGNLCKECAKKLSPWFNERRSSTVAEIKEQLAWREANRARAAQFSTTRAFGERTKLLLDDTHRWFTLTQGKNPAEDNADVLDYSVITGCSMDVKEKRTELKIESRNSEGKIVSESYSPPRYEYDYDFYITVSVKLPYFSEMRFQVNDRPVYIPFRTTGSIWLGNRSPKQDPHYRRYEEMCNDICNLLKNADSAAGYAPMPGVGGFGRGAAAPAGNPYAAGTREAEIFEEKLKDISWICKGCGCPNNGTPTCRECGAPLSDEGALSILKNLVQATMMMEQAEPKWTCQFCGSQNAGKFCESCGAGKQ